MEEKSANKLWRESGTTLSYKEWRNRENAKKQDTTLSFIGEQNVKDTLNNVYTSASNNTTTPQNSSSVLGLNKTVLIVSGVVIATSLAYYFYRKFKK